MLIKNSKDEIQNFLTDASNLKGDCDAVYFPESASDIQDIVKDADKNNVSVTVAGNGTGLTGARVPQSGIVISTEKLNKIIEINEQSNFVTVEPGVLLSDLQKELKLKDLFYPPDPTETNCFIGGTIATNASGARTFKYGPTRNYILGLEIILPDGEMLILERGNNLANSYKMELMTDSGKKINLDIPQFNMPDVKNASGYYCKINMDAIDLFIGSEGTLGIVTKAKLKILPVPDDLLSCVVFFNDENDALAFVSVSRTFSLKSRKSADPDLLEARALEFFDSRSLKFLAAGFNNIPRDAKAAVWFEQEVSTTNTDLLLSQWVELITENNGGEESAWFAFSDTDKNKIKDFRHAISSKVNEYIVRHNFRKLGTDVAVPDENFSELYFYSKDIVEEAGIDYVVYGHFGNSHMHLNMLPKNDDEFLRGKEIYSQICQKAVSLRGTISAEHGIGKIKRDFLLKMYGEETLKAMLAIKKILDPELLLGRGNIFGEELLSS